MLDVSDGSGHAGNVQVYLSPAHFGKICGHARVENLFVCVPAYRKWLLQIPNDILYVFYKCTLHMCELLKMTACTIGVAAIETDSASDKIVKCQPTWSAAILGSHVACFLIGGQLAEEHRQYDSPAALAAIDLIKSTTLYVKIRQPFLDRQSPGVPLCALRLDWRVSKRIGW